MNHASHDRLHLQQKNNDHPGDDKQVDFRQPHAHARFTSVHSRTRQFGECHHTHSNSHSTTGLTGDISKNEMTPISIVPPLRYYTSQVTDLSKSTLRVRADNYSKTPQLFERPTHQSAASHSTTTPGLDDWERNK